MSNFQGKSQEFTPQVYTRYFERTESQKSSSRHTHFNEEDSQASRDYQVKRDSLFKRLFPTKFADSNDTTNNKDQIVQNGIHHSLNRSSHVLGDFIPLSNNDSSSTKRKSASPPLNRDLPSNADDKEDDSIVEHSFPTIRHDSIIGHLHPRPTIENVRATLIRELYQRSSDPHTEWLKCKMGLPQDYIHPKYYADFQRRYRKDIQRNKMKQKKSTSADLDVENSYQVVDLTDNDESRITTRTNDTFESDDIIETSFTTPIEKPTSSSFIDLSKDSPKQSKVVPEFIVLESDDDDNEDDKHNSTNDSLSKSTSPMFFIDRSSTSLTAVLQPLSVSNDDYHEDDSKYDQLPSLNTSANAVIRPILSKHQRRKQSRANDSSKPLVSAIDRIIDEIDKNHSLDNPTAMQEQNVLIKQIKKRKKNKKNKTKLSNTN